jgi:hypothetical protein
MYPLTGPVRALPVETGSQDRVPLGDPLPGAPKSRDVQLLAHVADGLFDVHAIALLLKTAEEHGMLERRQRIDILQRGAWDRKFFRAELVERPGR